MNTNGCDRIPRELFHWITFLVQILPLRSVGTCIELLISAMLTPTGFVTDAYLIIDAQRHWTTYYKWLQKGKWSWLALVRRFVSLTLSNQSDEVVHLAIDDTLTLRSSKKAPGSQIHHQHGNKPNLANFVRGQCWVSLAMIIKRSPQSWIALPYLSRLIDKAGNQNKLQAANTLLRAVNGLFHGRSVRVLVDSWYMRRHFIFFAQKQGYEVIGQVRKDTQCFDPPSPKKQGQRGRPRRYGEKYTAKRVAHLNRTTVDLDLYGQKQTVRYRSKLVLVKFLEGQLVRVVWCELKSGQDEWKPARLFLSTDTSLTPDEILTSYGYRWSIETMFNQLKLAWGLNAAWQQTRQTLHRWVHITMIGYGLLQMLSCIGSEQVSALCEHSPWRVESPVTAGQVRKGLVRVFTHVNVRAWWSPTCRKYQPPNGVKQA